MSEVIKVELNEGLVRKFKKRAMEEYGYKKGTQKTALEKLIKNYTFFVKSDWSFLRGVLDKNISSVELQHTIWSKVD